MINEFGQRSLVTWTFGLRERIKKMEAEYICLTCGETYADGDTYCCSRCGAEICPKCGGDMTTIQEYNEAMRVNARES